jgi:hypothetical protein
MELDEWGTIHGNADIPADSELGYSQSRQASKRMICTAQAHSI